MARLLEEKIQERIADLARRGITVLGREYRKAGKSTALYFDVKCRCGHKWNRQAFALKKSGCITCRGKLPKDEIRERIKDLAFRGITVLGQEYRKRDGRLQLFFDVECQCGEKWANT